MIGHYRIVEKLGGGMGMVYADASSRQVLSAKELVDDA
jgi:hypothetical protein